MQCGVGERLSAQERTGPSMARSSQPSTLTPAFTPTSRSWLSLIKTWLPVLTPKALTNDASFVSVTEL